ncbi:hypothetical protein CPB84DRAFT_1769795 [Gymnopilus junonius]|uniref:Uncharacterized protein n=1 Tax=Gymnopilus junonius TaxID=109634 RepID=A0A9P5NU98_GYMJU|nr:hypothetical protein CPB84DRAFT_1769795 [Gymnopilus junonius]
MITSEVAVRMYALSALVGGWVDCPLRSAAEQCRRSRSPQTFCQADQPSALARSCKT